MGILSVWETDLDCTITHLLVWRGRTNNAENLSEGILYAAARIPSVINNFSPKFIEAFLSLEKNTVFNASVLNRFLKIKLIAKCLKYNCWLLTFYILHFYMFSSKNFHCLNFGWSALCLLLLGYKKFSVLVFGCYTRIHTLLKFKFIFMQNG